MEGAVFSQAIHSIEAFLNVLFGGDQFIFNVFMKKSFT
jgi:hypothetical protein